MSAKRKRRTLEEARKRKRRRIFIIAIIALIIAETGYILAVTRFNVAGLFVPSTPTRQTPTYAVALLNDTELFDIRKGVLDGAPSPEPNYVMVIAPSYKYVGELSMSNCTQVFLNYVRKFNESTVYLTILYPTFAGGRVYPTYRYELLYVAEELTRAKLTDYHNVKVVVLDLTDSVKARRFLGELAGIIAGKLGRTELTGEMLINNPWLLIVKESRAERVEPLFC